MKRSATWGCPCPEMCRCLLRLFPGPTCSRPATERPCAQPVRAIGEQAAQLILDRLDGKIDNGPAGLVARRCCTAHAVRGASADGRAPRGGLPKARAEQPARAVIRSCVEAIENELCGLSPIARTGWATVVSCGRNTSAHGKSSKQATDTSQDRTAHVADRLHDADDHEIVGGEHRVGRSGSINNCIAAL